MSSYRRYAAQRSSVERASHQIERHKQETYAEPFPDGRMYFEQFAERFAAMPIAAPDPCTNRGTT